MPRFFGGFDPPECQNWGVGVKTNFEKAPVSVSCPVSEKLTASHSPISNSSFTFLYLNNLIQRNSFCTDRLDQSTTQVGLEMKTQTKVKTPYLLNALFLTSADQRQDSLIILFQGGTIDSPSRARLWFVTCPNFRFPFRIENTACEKTVPFRFPTIDGYIYICFFAGFPQLFISIPSFRNLHPLLQLPQTASNCLKCLKY